LRDAPLNATTSKLRARDVRQSRQCETGWRSDCGPQLDEL